VGTRVTLEGETGCKNICMADVEGCPDVVGRPGGKTEVRVGAAEQWSA
jgi:hypothetical protein